MCYIGRLKGSMYLVNARLVVRNAAKTANTKLDLRNAANSLQIEGKGGATWGPSTVPLPPCGVVGVWHCPPPPLWCGGGVVWYVGYVWCVWSVWYGMFGKYGMFGMYGRYGMYGMSGWYCMDGRYGM